MIRIETIAIREFRGIRELELELDRENFGICGPNGTGKSGVVDAIEFALTGDISRLSGRGTGDLSVKAHGPHVDKRKHPENAKVELTAFIPSLGKSATISRSVANASEYHLAPDDPEIRRVFEKLQIHPEFALSRRDIIRYILARPNDRASDVQELLRLAEVEGARKALTTVANNIQRRRDQKQEAHLTERNTLLNILKIEKPDASRVLKVVNASRAILSLPALEKLDATTAFKQGVPDMPKAAPLILKKADAQADLALLAKIHTGGEPEEAGFKRTKALGQLQQLIDDAASLRTLRQQALVKAGIELVEGDSCPLCDSDWERDALLKHLTAKLDSAKAATSLLSELNGNINHVIAERNAFASLLRRLESVCGKLTPAVDAKIINTCLAETDTGTAALREFVSHRGGINLAKEVLEREWWVLPKGAQAEVDACAAGVATLPDVSKEDEARDFLTRAEVQYARAVRAKAEFEAAEKDTIVAAKALEIYEAQSDAILEALYDEVATDFTAYYRSLNREDEGEFEGKLIPSAAKLGFNVDFYGRGKFPPGAYHSEGHQDGMGLCLYLALMKRTLGEKFTFSVLDDVVMSIDADHRREVCKLLRSAFPDTQFILTTHDRVWLKFMQTEGLIKKSVSFSGWTVETGPKVWQHREIWDEIDEALKKDNVASAAGKLRRYLEYVSAILADSFRAEVRFKGDGQYDLGDLMPPVINRWRKKLNDAINAAKSWGKNADAAALALLLAKFDNARARVRIEQWALNPAVHYNSWENFQANEFREVVRAFADLLAPMQCKTCKSFVEMQPRNQTAEIIRCNCGDISINLKKKAA